MYIPVANQIYSVGDKVGLFATHFHGRIERLFVTHVCENVGPLHDYLNTRITGFSLVLRLGHLGHHLWNELTETDNLLHSQAYGKDSDVVLMHGSKVEPLGRIETIFPGLTGRVVRDIEIHRDLVRYCYAKGRCLIEPTTFYVPRKLAGRIVDINLAQADVQPDKADLARYKADGYQVLLVGLRVENRTDTDLDDFCICVADAAMQVMGPLVVVIDCLNADFAEPILLDAQTSVARRLAE